MADVVTALGRAVKEAGHDVRVIVPKYDVINYAEVSSLALLLFHLTSTKNSGCRMRLMVDQPPDKV